MLKNKGGFTLIELIMIIVILGILAAVAIPKYQDLANEARQAVVDGNAGALKSTAVIAFAKNRGVKVGFAASILSQLNYENVSIIYTNCASTTGIKVQHNDNTAIYKDVDLSEYCSGP
jgi:MSHA pilin protein MshA